VTEVLCEFPYAELTDGVTSPVTPSVVGCTSFDNSGVIFNATCRLKILKDHLCDVFPDLSPALITGAFSRVTDAVHRRTGRSIEVYQIPMRPDQFSVVI
jgi:hypothetical protein